jgi:Universal stress protein UspA and related nucleotide-binding proteins
MQKILLALDRRQVNMNVLDFACFVSRLCRSELTVLFLQEGKQEPVTEAVKVGAGTSVASAFPDRGQAGANDRLLFESACQNRGASFRIQEREGDDPLEEMLRECRFADLLIVDPEISFGKRDGVPSSFLKDVLAKSECPVAIAPYSFDSITEIIFAYDGSASAIHAIKQFSYLFPGLSDCMLTILQVSDESPAPLIEKKKLIEFLQAHYSSIGYRILEGKASDELFRFLHDKKNLFVVMGAYGRRNLATLFRHSTADRLLQSVNLPIFIAHKD